MLSSGAISFLVADRDHTFLNAGRTGKMLENIIVSINDLQVAKVFARATLAMEKY